MPLPPFANRFTHELPPDPETANFRRQVYGACFSRVQPTPVAAPKTVAWSPEVADLLGLDPAWCESEEFADIFAGNLVPEGADPFAMNYGGHQFGHWAGQLGDGRAIALGEVVDRDGVHQMLQLKGAGPTPYSRTADGRAVLRSSLREFLCSEAMHHLGIPTTRALSLVETGDAVVRDILYNGNPLPEPGAVVCRVAPSFTRFGSFQLPASRGELDVLRRLVDFTIRNDFPGFDPADIGAWFAEVCSRTARLVVDWMRVGFVHGVLNTDNMSILGLTIDYGPYGWLEDFDPGWTPNTTDAGTLRYRYGSQPEVAHWNLLQLANALVQLTQAPEPLEEGLARYGSAFTEGFASMTRARLGWGDGPAHDGDDELVGELFRVLTLTEVDQVLFFRGLSQVSVDAPDIGVLADAGAFYELPDQALSAWLEQWAARARAADLPEGARVKAMDALNPKYVLRNYLAQEAIDAAEAGDTGLLHELLDVLRRPYDDQPGKERFAARRPEWARKRVGCSMLSCSS